VIASKTVTPWKTVTPSKTAQTLIEMRNI